MVNFVMPSGLNADVASSFICLPFDSIKSCCLTAQSLANNRLFRRFVVIFLQLYLGRSFNNVFTCSARGEN